MRVGARAAALLIAAARWSGRRSGVVIMYHDVGDPQGDWTRELVPPIGTELFEAQLRHLGEQYKVVPASQIIDAAMERRRGELFPVAITFDDDLSSHARIAAPLLERLGLSATFFLSGASLDGPFSFWWQRLQRATDLGLPIKELVEGATTESAGEPRIQSIAETIERMPPEERAAVSERLLEWVGSEDLDNGLSREDVSVLVGAGSEIGFHTLEHHRLTTLDDAALAASMNEGRARLAEATGADIDLIAYPHGAADARVARAAASAGYRFGFTTEQEPVTGSTDRHLIGRVGTSYASIGRFAIKVAGKLLRRT